MGVSFRRQIRKLEGEAHELVEIERAGDREEAPLISIGMVMTVVLPIAVTMMLLAFGAAWLFA